MALANHIFCLFFIASSRLDSTSEPPSAEAIVNWLVEHQDMSLPDDSDTESASSEDSSSDTDTDSDIGEAADPYNEVLSKKEWSDSVTNWKRVQTLNSLSHRVLS